MAKNLVGQVSKAGGDFEVVEREIPAPAAGEVRIKVKACGVCHSDAATKFGAFPFITYPRVPGHEVAGGGDEVGGGGAGGEKGGGGGGGWGGGGWFWWGACRGGGGSICKEHDETAGARRARRAQ